MRLKQYYVTTEPGEAISIGEWAATLIQNETETHGILTLEQVWSPMAIRWEFKSDASVRFDYEKIRIETYDFSFETTFCDQDYKTVEGYLESDLRIGLEQTLDRVTFHLPYFEDLIGQERFEEPGTCDYAQPTTWSTVRLEAEDWLVSLQPVQNIKSLSGEGIKVSLVGVGEISRKDNAVFSGEAVKELLACLRYFLSFAFNTWVPPVLVLGSYSDHNKCRWFLPQCELKNSQRTIRGWLPLSDGQSLSDSFPGFFAKWSTEQWREPIELAVTWLIDAHHQSNDIGGSIAFGQIPLEMLACMKYVEDDPTADEKRFDRLPAWKRVEYLLVSCGISTLVPPELPTLALVNKNIGNLGGPSTITQVRNTIIHPSPKNRQMLLEWQDTFNADALLIRSECKRLFEYYTVLVLLNIIGYSGRFASPLTFWGLLGQDVPWRLNVNGESTI